MNEGDNWDDWTDVDWPDPDDDSSSIDDQTYVEHLIIERQVFGHRGALWGVSKEECNWLISQFQVKIGAELAARKLGEYLLENPPRDAGHIQLDSFSIPPIGMGDILLAAERAGEIEIARCSSCNKVLRLFDSRKCEWCGQELRKS